MIADNRLIEIASWDDRLLGEQLRELSELNLNFSLELTGFEMPEIDPLIEGHRAGFGITLHRAPMRPRPHHFAGAHRPAGSIAREVAVAPRLSVHAPQPAIFFGPPQRRRRFLVYGALQ